MPERQFNLDTNSYTHDTPVSYCPEHKGLLKRVNIAILLIFANIIICFLTGNENSFLIKAATILAERSGIVRSAESIPVFSPAIIQAEPSNPEPE